LEEWVSIPVDLLVGTIATLLGEAITHATRLRTLRSENRSAEALHDALAALDEEVGITSRQIYDDISEALGPTPRQEAADFLRSSDFEQFVRIYVAAIRAELDRAVHATLLRYVTKAASIYLDRHDAATVAKLVTGRLDDALGRLMSDRKLREFLELDPSAVGTAIVLTQLDNLPGLVEFWEGFDKKKETELRAVLDRHREQAHSSANRVTPPDFTERRLVPLHKIYVVPHIDGFYKKLDELLYHVRRRRLGGIVVLGDPGAGKTTLVRFLLNRLTVPRSDLATAVLVPLRDFESRRRDRAESVAEYVADYSKEKYQVAATAELWETAFTRGSVAVLFDGLDELVDVNRRLEMAEIIEGFVTRYPDVPTIVTCRFAGYTEAALPATRFRTVRLLPFDDRQVTEYVTKWFDLEGNSLPELSPSTSALYFLRESVSTSELRSNPLLLSLLCLLFRGRGYIPENLSGVYQECAELLFERWDLHRQVKVARFGDRLRKLLDRLAWWMYTEGLNEVGVPEEALFQRCLVELRELKAYLDSGVHHLIART
jgi:hypothetical protein